MKQHSMSCPYPEGCTCGASEFNRVLKDNEELNRRLAKRVIDFNETDKKRLARIQELEEKMDLEATIVSDPSFIKYKDKVSKVGGDYKFDGTVVAVFTKLSGAIRYVVEDDRGVLHIYSGKNLQRQ